ncbi:DEAD/DEAH box helicase family protein [Streptomyces sp. NPDC059142]|uniref:DEAD/DEAH box helicase family protein n=1 Tax=Streptomyces sp. NPDC059142 TaxID=3346739 RepID=UPI0036915A36
MEALRVLEREQRRATAEEQSALARWSGWGALPVIFNPRPARAGFGPNEEVPFERAAARWEAVSDLREQIRTLLTEDEWAAARRNTINAHYTDADLVRSIWDAVRGLIPRPRRGLRFLEPGCGSGNFIGLSPVLMPVQMTGVEVEPTTAAIARHLYPDAEIITSGLEAVRLADGGFDGVVGNVPFGRYKRFDKVHNPDLKLSIHDHFVLKSLYATRPGGVVALITSRYTLDAEKPDARERMYRLGDLVGAVRLPAKAHRASAGTDVVTDVLFLRRRMDGEEPGDRTWLTASKRVLPGHDDELAMNTYFDAHPENVLGELRAGSREWGPDVTVVGRTDQTPAEALSAAAAGILVEARAAGLTAVSDQRAEPVERIVTGGTEGALGLDADGNPTIIDGGRPAPLEVHSDQREQLVQLIRLKGLTLALYAAEADTPEPGETPQLARLRAELRVAWRDYRKSYPPLTKPRQYYRFTPPGARERATAQGFKEVPEAWKARTAFAWIDDDPDASLLFGLEEWDDRTGKGAEQKVLLTRVLEPRTLPIRAHTHEDAIALAMEHDGGRLDMSRVASLLAVDEESAAAQCADAGLAYRDPQQHDLWEPSHRYLSGNVRTKLAAARERAADDPTFQANVAALERIQPTDLTPSEIKAKIGAPWIPVDVYNDFLAHLGFEDASVVHAGGTIWEVRGAKNGDLARTEWGTSSRPTQDLFTSLLRQAESTIQVTYRDRDGRTYVDKAATDEAQEKARLITEAFDDWVWEDKTRAAQLAKVYNELLNNLVLTEHSEAPLSLPGLIAGWNMKDHQNAAIRRIVHEPTALLAHVVGAGKTATMAAGAMELRRTGLARKPALVVPNHMLKQWSREFRQLYPNAKILAISASDLSVKRRAKFMGRIAGGEWDAVILTHEAFNRVPLRPENMRSYLDRELASLRLQLDEAAEAGMHRNTVKQIEESLANAEAKLQQQIEAVGDDNGVFLEDTGVDYLFLDEAHEYKNLRTVSAIPGASIQGSAKATKLHMVLSWLRETNDSDRVATLATGTPIANSVTEAYVLKRYLAPQLLAEMGLEAFDNWAATFGEVVSNLEPDPKGDGYKYKARFARFFNVPELMAGYRVFADVRTAEDLDLPTPPVRENEDGQRGETVLIPPTPVQRQFIKQLPHQPWVRKPGGVLKALGEGLRASVDLDLVDVTQALESLGSSVSADQITGKALGSKIPYAAERIAEIWQETKDIVYPVSGSDPAPQELRGGLQLVFLDEGTPGSTAKHAANLYADLRDELVAKGVPRESIRFIHEAGTDRKKEKLFADCRSGRVRVLVGSTQKMGTGTNIQDRATALHHLSYPWRPADMAQRDGRIERRGNLNAPWIANTPDDVRVFYYITERTFDEFRLTTLARKARFISQIQRKDFSAREIEDIGADALNIGMLAALASGDPAILQLAEATAERSRLQGLARSWDRQQDGRSQQLTDIENFLARADIAREGMRVAAPNRRPTAGDAFAMTVADATYRSREAAANALGARMVTIAGDQSIRPGDRVPVGTLGGQDFHAEVVYGASGRRQMRLRFAWGYVVPLGQREDRAQWQASSVTQSNGRGAIQSLERFLSHLDDDLKRLDESAETLRGRREEIADNLRPKDENPYRIQARSKEREERSLGKLVVANEKEAALAERAERAASVSEQAAEGVNEELEAMREHITVLRKSITDEHEIQAAARGFAQDESRPGGAAGTRFGDDGTADTAAGAGTGPAETPPPTAGQQGSPPQTEPQDQPGQRTPEPAAPAEPEVEPSSGPPAPETPGNGAASEQKSAEAEEVLLSGAAAVPEDPTPAITDDDRQVAVPDGSRPSGDGGREPQENPAPAEPAQRLPELSVTAPNLDEVPQFHDAEPFTDQDDLADVQRLETAYDRWSRHPTVRAYLAQDRTARPDSFGTPDNPIAELHIAYHRARLALREPVSGGPEEIVRRIYGVAAWCMALEPVVERGLLDPLQDVYAASHGLAARSQATIAALPAEQSTTTEEAPADAQQTPDPGDRPLEPSPRAPETEMSAPGPAQETAEAPAGADPGAPGEEPGLDRAEPEQRTGPSEAMVRIAAVLRYYEPLLQRHKLSGKTVVAYIDRPGVGYSYDPDNPTLDLVHEIGKVGERVGGSFRISYHEWVNRQVSEQRAQQSEQLTNLCLDLITLYQDETEPLWTVDLEAILAAPPGTVIELPSEAQIAAEEAAAARIVIDHDPEGTEVRNTPPGGDQRIRDALNDLGFNWSRRQQKWYQRRNTPFEVRDTAVQRLRAAFEDLGVAYTCNGPAPDTDGSVETEQQENAPLVPDSAEEAGPREESTEEPVPPPTVTEPDPPAPTADPGVPDNRPQETETDTDPETTPDAAPTVIVQTPDGPGTVVGTDDGDLVLVTTHSGTRVWDRSEIQWPDGAAPQEDADRAAKERKNAADAAQAATSEGIELRYGDGNRLVDLDTEAGYGTVVDTDGAVIGWVRARIADDGRRYWWAQDARGGAPDNMPFHEALPPSAGVPAIRAAGAVNSGLHAFKEPPHRSPTTPEYAAREVRLTTAQVRELRRLALDATYSDGTPIEPPDWVTAHRKYVLNTAQMQALGDAARAAADAFPGATAPERRTARVLRNAAKHFEFEVYDTARWRATIPPIGESDPYAKPYQPRPWTETDTPGAALDEPAPEEQGVEDQPAERTTEEGTVASPGEGETEQLGLFGGPAKDPSEGPAEPETATGSGAVPEDGREAQLRAALIEGETITPVSFTDRREPAEGWILTTAGGHAFRLRPVSHSSPDDQWEAGHDVDGSYWWNANLEDRPLEAVLARVREDTATRTRFVDLWARHGHLTAQAPQFETTTNRVQLEEGVYLVHRFGRIGLIASCRWGWEHLTDADGAQGQTGEDWSRKGPDTRQYVAERKIWGLAQEAIPAARLRVVAQLTDDMADTPDAYCDASQPYVGKCSAKRSGARYTVAVDDDQGSELGCYTVCARCLSHRLLSDENVGYRDVESLAGALAKGDPKVVDLHWKQWSDRAAELAGQMLSTALDAGEASPWPAQALTSQILTEACEAGDDRARREARAAVKAAGGTAKAQKRAADEAFAGRQDRAALVARRGATPTEAADETDGMTAAILGFAGWGTADGDAAPEPAEGAAPQAADVAAYTDRAPAGEALAQAHHPETSTADAAPQPLATVVTPTLDDVAQTETAEAPAVEAAAQEGDAPDRTADENPDQPDQEEEVADEREPTSATTTDTPVGLPGDALPPAVPETAADAGPTVSVEDPPAPRPYTEVSALPADPDYQLHLTGLDGKGPSAGELRHEGTTIATVHLATSGRWFARLADDERPDLTALNASPQDAAHQGAMLFSAFTGTPYGAAGPAVATQRLSRADVLRTDLQDAAQQHLNAIATAAGRVPMDYINNPQFQELSSRLGELGAAAIDVHDSQRMAANLVAVQEAVNAWGDTLRADRALHERRFLAFPLAHLMYDTTYLQDRLDATLEAAQAEQSAARKQEAAAAASAEPVPPPAPAEAPAAERVATVAPTEPSAPPSAAPEDAGTALPAGPVTPGDRVADDPASATTGTVSEPGDGQLPQDEDWSPAAPDPSGELPLWTGPTDTSTQPQDRPLDVVADFDAVREAWDEHVPGGNGTSADLFASVEEELGRLEALFAEVVANMPVPEAGPAVAVQPSEAESVAVTSSGERETAEREGRGPQQTADAVNTALRQADAHAPAVRDLPEWQHIQTVRGAFGNLMTVMKERAGEHIGKLMADSRVADFVRRVSIRVCEKIAELAQAAADRLRRDDGRSTEQPRDLPSADALLRLGDAAAGYSGPRRGGGGTPPPPPPANGEPPAALDAMRKMGEALNRPMPGATRRVSAAAARGRSTTAKRVGKRAAPTGDTEQAGHLRNSSAEQHQPRKPTQR